MSTKDIMERLNYKFQDPETRAVQAMLYRETIDGKLTLERLQEHIQYLDMDIRTLSCLSCIMDCSIERFEGRNDMVSAEQRLTKQVNMIQSGFYGHTTDIMEERGPGEAPSVEEFQEREPGEFPSVEEFQVLGVRLIHLFVRNDSYLHAADFLHKCNCDLNADTLYLRLSPVDIAVRENQAQMVKFLVESDCEINRKVNSKRQAPIEVAVENRSEEIVDILLTRKDIELNLGNDSLNDEPLLLRCIKERPQFVGKLLESGASPNVFSECGLTSLMYSVTQRDISMIKLLLQHDANPNLIPANLPARMRMALTYGCPLLHAIVEDDTAIMKLLLDAGADPNYCVSDYFEQSALMTAVYSGGCNEKVKLLIQYGSSVNHRDSEDYAPIHFAAWHGEDEIMTMLLEAGAEHDTQTTDLNTPLAFAANGGYLGPMKQLLALQCNVNNTDKDLDTPLHYAAFNGMTEGVRMLLEAGANPELCNRVNASALWNAVYSGHTEVVKQLLLENVKMEVCSTGRDPSPSDEDVYFYDVPKSPIFVAVDRDRSDIAMMLLAAGYNVQKEKWLLEEAVSERDEKLVSALTKYSQSPLSLEMICRTLIRCHMGCCRNISEKVDQLDIPRSMKEFLKLKHLDSEAQSLLNDKVINSV